MRRRMQNSSPLSLFSFQDIITATTGILILITLILCLSITHSPENVSQTPRDIDKLLAEKQELTTAVEKLRADLESSQQRAQQLISLSPAEIEKEKEASLANLARMNQLISQLEKEIQNTEKELNSPSPLNQALTADSAKLQQVQQQLAAMQAELDQLVNSDRVLYNFRDTKNQVPWVLEVCGDQLLAARFGQRQKPVVFNQPSEPARLQAFSRWLEGLPKSDRYFVTIVKPSGARIYQSLGSQQGVRPLLERNDAVVGVDLIPESQTAVDPVIGAGF